MWLRMQPRGAIPQRSRSSHPPVRLSSFSFAIVAVWLALDGHVFVGNPRCQRALAETEPVQKLLASCAASCSEATVPNATLHDTYQLSTPVLKAPANATKGMSASWWPPLRRHLGTFLAWVLCLMRLELPLGLKPACACAQECAHT